MPKNCGRDHVVTPVVMKNTFLAPRRNRAGACLAPLVALTGLAAFLGGCASEPESRLVSSPPPGPPAITTATASSPAPAVTATPATTTTGQPTVVVTQSPPALQSEVIPPRPSSDYVWVAGYWAWRNDRYEWVAGHWSLPPHAGATWVPPRWEPESGSYRFYDGYWD